MFCWNEAILGVVRDLKARSDVHAIVAMVHWGGAVRYDQGGDRYSAAITMGEREIAHYFPRCPLASETHVRRRTLQNQHQIHIALYSPCHPKGTDHSVAFGGRELGCGAQREPMPYVRVCLTV